MIIAPYQRLMIADRMMFQQAIKPARGSGLERKAAVVRWALESFLPRPRWCPEWAWKIGTAWAARQIAVVIDAIHALWERRFGKAWILTDRQRLEIIAAIEGG